MTAIQPAESPAEQPPADAPQPPAAPAIADAPPATPAADVAIGVRAAPRTAAELRGLRAQRKELSDQLVSAQGRRRDVARAIERADDATVRQGLRERLTVLDRRILQLEQDISETGRLITTAAPELIASAESPRFEFNGPRGGPPDGVIPIAIIFILFVLFPLALAMSRGIWRRGRHAPPAMDREAVERLARLEQAVDAIAIEVERVSEGQRFVTRVLSEARGAPALPAPEETREAVAGGGRY